jgi:methylated-DNA-protein-cysteine methyltransferase-like protein
VSGKRSSSYQRIFAVIRRIPHGRVATYGQIARLAGLPGQARQVGYALHSLPSSTAVPWQRVVNASGGVSPRSANGAVVAQRILLEREGVIFDSRGRISLARFGWRPRSRPPRT